MSEYELKRDGVDAQVKAAKDTAEQLRNLSGSNTLESATITGPDGFQAYDEESGARIQLALAFLRFVNDLVPGTGSSLSTTEGELVLQAWKQSGILFGETSLSLVGKSETTPGAAILRSGGDVYIRSTDAETEEPTGSVNVMASSISLDASTLPIYSLPTTSATANLHLGTVGGQWTVAYVTSSRRYKTNIADAEIDADAVLRWKPRTWRDKSETDIDGVEPTEHIGFIAEEIHEQTPEFVVLDDEGQPNALKYDRMVAGLLAVVQKQDQQIADLTARLEALEAK